MADTKYLKCICSSCGGRIEFPAEGVGMTVPCPHCGWKTELNIEVPAEAIASVARSRKWLFAGVVILAIGLVGGLCAVLIAQNLVRKSQAQRIANRSVPRPGRTNALAASRQAPLTNGINDFSVSEVKIQKTPGSTLIYASGTLKNETDKPRFDVTVELDLLDGAGLKIGTAKDYKDTVESRAQWTFRALVVKKETRAARVASIREQL